MGHGKPTNVKIATYQFESKNKAVEFAEQYNSYSQFKIAILETQEPVDRKQEFGINK